MEESELYNIRTCFKGSRCKLYDLATWKNGAAFKGVKVSPSGKPIIKIAELNNGISESTICTDEQFSEDILLHKGDLVFAWSGNPETSIDIFRYNLTDGWLNQHIFKITVNEKVVDRDFFFYLMKYIKPNFKIIASNKQTTGLGHVTIADLKAITVTIPNHNLQRHIAEILKSLDDKIELNNRINHNLEEQAQALFKSWFVDFEPFKQGQFVNTEMGLIPKDWSIVPFFDIVRLCSGGTPKTDQPDYWGGNIPFFTPKDVSSSPFCLKTEKYITKTGLDHCNSHLYEPFTTFITARGTVGKLCMAGYPMAMNQTNYAICSINIDPILAFLFSKQIVNNLKNKANGAVFDAITTRDFEGERVIMAPDSILSEFSSTIRPLYNQILENEKQSFALSKTRELVLPALMTGQTINHNC